MPRIQMAAERKTIALPPRIYLINSKGRHYSMSQGIVSFTKTVPDETCEVLVEYLTTTSEEFYLRAWTGAYFQYHHSKPTHVEHKKPFKEKSAIRFTAVDIEDQKFVFRTSNGKFIQPESNEKNRIGLGGYQNAGIKIGDPTIKRVISNITYNVNSATITELSPEVALKITIRNNSPLNTYSQSLKFSYDKSTMGTWKNQSTKTRLDLKSLSMVEIPCLSDGRIDSTFTQNESHNSFRGAKVETKKVDTSIAVPTRKKGVATVLIHKAVINVPFTYDEAIWYRGGGHDDKRGKKGVYNNLESYGMEIRSTDMIDI